MSPSRPRLSLAVDMLSDLSCNTLDFDVHDFPDTSTVLPEEGPLSFDDLLDIAREFEFTRTITHIWPCEEEPTTFPETGLEDIFATIVHMPHAEESPLPLPTSSPSTNVDLDPVHVQEIHLHRPASASPAPDVNASIAIDPVPLPKDDNQVRTETGALGTSILRGWSPPSGSQFLDLSDNLMLPQPAKDLWIPPGLAVFLAPPNVQPAGNTNQPFPTVSRIGDVQTQTAATQPKSPPMSATDETADGPRKENVPTVPLPIRARSALQTKSSQTVTTPRAKPPKSRPHPSSAPAAGVTSGAKHAKPPRGGIPPHIARSVTKANILRVEKERKVIQDAFSSTTTEGKKPSVLRGAATAERETGKIASRGSSAKKLSNPGENDEKEGRAAKRARV